MASQRSPKTLQKQKSTGYFSAYLLISSMVKLDSCLGNGSRAGDFAGEVGWICWGHDEGGAVPDSVSGFKVCAGAEAALIASSLSNSLDPWEVKRGGPGFITGWLVGPNRGWPEGTSTGWPERPGLSTRESWREESWADDPCTDTESSLMVTWRLSLCVCACNDLAALSCDLGDLEGAGEPHWPGEGSRPGEAN